MLTHCRPRITIRVLQSCFFLFILKTSTMKLQPILHLIANARPFPTKTLSWQVRRLFNKATSKEMMPDGIDAKESLGWNDNLWNEDRD